MTNNRRHRPTKTNNPTVKANKSQHDFGISTPNSGECWLDAESRSQQGRNQLKPTFGRSRHIYAKSVLAFVGFQASFVGFVLASVGQRWLAISSQRSFADVVRDTRKSTDEEQWERQQRRKRRTPPAPTVPQAGPCCARCQHWRSGEPFGTCTQAAVIEKRSGSWEKGTVLSMGEVPLLDPNVVWDYLRTKPGFSCSQFADQSQTLAEEPW